MAYGIVCMCICEDRVGTEIRGGKKKLFSKSVVHRRIEYTLSISPKMHSKVSSTRAQCIYLVGYRNQ